MTNIYRLHLRTLGAAVLVAVLTTAVSSPTFAAVSVRADDTAVTITAGNLSIIDVADKADDLTITYDGADVIITTAVGTISATVGTGGGTAEVRVPIGLVTGGSVVVDLAGGVDVFEVDDGAGTLPLDVDVSNTGSHLDLVDIDLGDNDFTAGNSATLRIGNGGGGGVTTTGSGAVTLRGALVDLDFFLGFVLAGGPLSVLQPGDGTTGMVLDLPSPTALSSLTSLTIGDPLDAGPVTIRDSGGGTSIDLTFGPVRIPLAIGTKGTLTLEGAVINNDGPGAPDASIVLRGALIDLDTFGAAVLADGPLSVLQPGDGTTGMVLDLPFPTALSSLTSLTIGDPSDAGPVTIRESGGISIDVVFGPVRIPLAIGTKGTLTLEGAVINDDGPGAPDASIVLRGALIDLDTFGASVIADGPLSVLQPGDGTTGMVLDLPFPTALSSSTSLTIGDPSDAGPVTIRESGGISIDVVFGPVRIPLAIGTKGTLTLEGAVINDDGPGAPDASIVLRGALIDLGTFGASVIADGPLSVLQPGDGTTGMVLDLPFPSALVSLTSLTIGDVSDSGPVTILSDIDSPSSSLTVGSGGSITAAGLATTGPDAILVLPGQSNGGSTNVLGVMGAATSVTINGGGGDDSFEVASFATDATLNGAGGTDSFAVEGTAGDDLFTLASSAIGVGANTITPISIESLAIDGLGGDDDLTVDFAFGNPVPVDGLAFGGDAEDAEDSITLTGTTALAVAHTFDTAVDGTITVDGNDLDYTSVEAFVDMLVAAARTFSFSGSDALILRDDATAGDDTFRIEGPFGPFDFTAPTGALTLEGNSLTVELDAAPTIIPGGGLTFNGLGNGAVLTVEPGDFVGSVVNGTHTFTSESDGSVDFDGSTITYTGLEPVIDLVPVTNRFFVFGAGDNNITFSADGDGAASNSLSFIDCDMCGEATTFANPTGTLTINAGAGADSVFVGEMDATIDAGFTLLTVNGDADADYISVVPSTSYAIAANGGAPASTCIAGDELDIDFSGTTGAMITYTDFLLGNGMWEFTSGHEDVTFTGFERQTGDAASLSIVVTPSLVYATERAEMTVKISNTGTNPARCVSAAIPQGMLALPDFDPDTDDTPYADAVGTTQNTGFDYATPTLAELDENGDPTAVTSGTLFGFYDGTADPDDMVDNDSTGVLDLGGNGFILDAGHMITFTLDDYVVNHAMMPFTMLFDVRSGDEVLDTDELEVNQGFFFPVKAHVNTAIYVDASEDLTTSILPGGPATYERLVVGIFQGAPGIEGAVWCRVPETVAAFWLPPTGFTGPAGESRLWRPCSGSDDPDAGTIALPFPLHPNKLFEDSNDTLWMTTWGSSGLYKSLDGGVTWEAAEPVLFPKSGWTNVYAITEDVDGSLYISANDGYVFRSLNGGNTWQQIGSLPHVDANTPWSLEAHVDMNNPGTVYAGTFGRGVYFTNDFGFTWSELIVDDGDDNTNENVDLYEADAGHIFDLVQAEDPNNVGDQYLFAATGTGVWRVRLDDAGADLGFIGAGEEWEFIGPEVELAAGSDVIPEIRALTLGPDASGTDMEPDLLAGAWGTFLVNDKLVTAFANATPFSAVGGSDSFEALALRGAEVSFIAVSPSGVVTFGTAGALVDIDVLEAATSTASAAGTELPTDYALAQNYPNPFNPVTTIAFDLPATSEIHLAVFDVLGREVALLASGSREAGRHEVQFAARNLPSGSYFYRLQTESQVFTRQLVLLK